MCHSKARRLAEPGEFFERGGPMRRAGILPFFGAVACASLPRSTSQEGTIDQIDQPVRIALAISAREALIGGLGSWEMYNRSSVQRIMRGKASDEVRVEQRGGRLVYFRGGAMQPNTRYAGPFIFRSTSPGALLRYDRKRYRGEIRIIPTDTGMLVINRLGVESYLRGVVPLEIGDRKAGEEAAVQAQAVAARTYSYVHMAEAGSRAFDMYGTVQDQVYGGADAEKPMADDAIAATKDMVIRFAGRV